MQQRDGAAVFQYEEAPPPPELREVVLTFWSFRTTEHAPATMEHTVWPDGCASLSVARVPGQPMFVRAIAPRTDARVLTVPHGSRFWGVRFWPDTGSRVLGVSVADLQDGPVPPSFAGQAGQLVERLERAGPTTDGWSALAEWSVENIAARRADDDAVRSAIRYIVLHAGGARVTDVAAAAAVGVRQLQRRFVQATGLTIKSYSRVRRLRSALARQLGVPESISRTAAEGGYADHAHLAREFAELTGMPPKEVLRHMGRIEHLNVVP